MTTHELARVLLEQEDLPVAVHANGHTYHSEYDRLSHGPLQIAVAESGRGTPVVLLGNMIPYRYPEARLLFEGERAALPEYEWLEFNVSAPEPSEEP